MLFTGALLEKYFKELLIPITCFVFVHSNLPIKVIINKSFTEKQGCTKQFQDLNIRSTRDIKKN